MDRIRSLRGWVVPVAGVLLLAVAAGVGIWRARRDGFLRPSDPPGSSGRGGPRDAAPDAPVRPEARRDQEQKALLDRLRAPYPADETARTGLEQALRVEAAQHPGQYDVLLAALLKDPGIDERLKVAALSASLVGFRPSTLEIVRAFAEGEPSSPLKRAALRTLGELGYRLRQDLHLSVPPACLALLDKLRTHDEAGIRAEAWIADWRIRHVSFGEAERAEFVRRVLEDPGPEVFQAFFSALVGTDGLHGPGIAGELAKRYAAFPDPRKRAMILAALGETGESGGHPLLAAGLGDPDPNVRIAAVRAAARLKDESQIPLMRVLLEDAANNAPELRRAILRTLAEIGSRDAVRALAAFSFGEADLALRDDALGRLSSARALRGDEATAALLLERLNDDAQKGRLNALYYALGATDLPASAEALKRRFDAAQDSEQRETLLRAALGMKQDAAYALLARGAGEVSVPSLRSGILRVLSEARRPELIGVLPALYASAAAVQDPDYRVELIDSAANVASPAALRFLRDAATRETDADVRARLDEAIETLSR